MVGFSCDVTFVDYINMVGSHGVPETTWACNNDNSRTLQAAVSNSQEGGEFRLEPLIEKLSNPRKQGRVCVECLTVCRQINVRHLVGCIN